MSLLLSCSGSIRTPASLDEPAAPANAGQRVWQIPLQWNSTLDGDAVASNEYLSYNVEFVPRAKWYDEPYLNVTGGDNAFVAGKPLMVLELKHAWASQDFRRWLDSGSADDIGDSESYSTSFTMQVPRGFRPEGIDPGLLRQIARVCGGESAALNLKCTPFLPLTIDVRDETGAPVPGCRVQMFPLTLPEESDEHDSWLALANHVRPARNFHTRKQARAWAETVRISDVTVKAGKPGTVAVSVTPRDFDLQGDLPGHLSGRTDDNGTLTLAALAPGHYMLAAAKPGFGFTLKELNSRGSQAQNLTVHPIAIGDATIHVIWPMEGERRLDCVLSPGMQCYVNEDNAFVELKIAADGADETELRVTGLPIGRWRLCGDRHGDWDVPVLHVKEGAPASVMLNLRDPQSATWRVRAFIGDEELHEFRFSHYADSGGDQGGRRVREDEGVLELNAGHYRACLGEQEWEFDLKPGDHRLDEIHIPLRDVTIEMDKNTASCFDADKPVQVFARAQTPHDDVFHGYAKSSMGKDADSKPLAVFSAERLAEFKLPSGRYALIVVGAPTAEFRHSPSAVLSFEIGIDLRGSGPVSIKLDPAVYPEVTPFDLELRGGKPGEQWFISNRNPRSTLLDPLDIDDDGRTDKAEYSPRIHIDWVAGTPLKRRYLGLPKDFAIYCSAVARPCEFALHLPITSRAGMIVDLDTMNSMPRIEFKQSTDHVPHLDAYARFECASGVTGWVKTHFYDPDWREVPFVPVTPGGVKIWFSRLDRHGLVRGIHRVELDVGKEGAVIDLNTLSRADFSLNELKVVLQGMPRNSALRNRMWFMRGDVEWASRAGYVFVGHCIEIELIEDGVPEARRPRFALGYCRSEFHPDLQKVYTAHLPPGRYKVIPWQDATDADCRTLEIKAGQAATIEIRCN